MKKKIIKVLDVKSITDEELDERNGSHNRFKINECFKKDSHYYCQMDGYILHAKKDIINHLHNSCLDEVNATSIAFEEFESMLLKAIFNLGIYKFTQEK